MARPLRIEFPAAACHLMARGHQGRAVLAGDQDRGRFLETLNLRKPGLGERALADGPSGQCPPRGESNGPGDEREAPTPQAPACLRTSVNHEGHKKTRTDPNGAYGRWLEKLKQKLMQFGSATEKK
jgi:hypothetical protein